MKLLLVILLAGLAAAAIDYQSEFLAFMRDHDRTYDHDEFHSRFAIFCHNRDLIEGWNAASTGHKLGVNRFADLTNEEYQRTYLTKIKTGGQRKGEVHVPSGRAPPASKNWADEGYVTDIKDQGQCGGCWSFSTTGSIEGANVAAGNTLVSLSEQNLMDCSWAYGNEGCNGGLMDPAFEYVLATGGIDTEESYPYTAMSSTTCKYSSENCGASISKYTDVTAYDESSLMDAVGEIGPVSVAIDASSFDFQLYMSGIYYESSCSQTALDHGVLAVGYGDDNGTPYWIVKNSWGTTWGQKGYIWMSKDRNNNCGIATEASYPTAKSPACS